MPAEYLHVACARDALSSLGGPPRWLDRASFNVGCQGPDVFSHNRKTRPLALAYARLLHRRDYGSFSSNFVALLGSNRDFPGFDTLRSWFLGFVTHAAVDRAVHPYVVSKSCPLSGDLPAGLDKSRLHAFFERILDDAFIGFRAECPSADAARIVRVPGGLADAVSPGIARSLEATYGEKAGDRVEERIRNAFADAGRVYELTAPERFPSADAPGLAPSPCPPDLAALIGYGASAVALLRPTGMRGRADWLNLSRSAWPDPATGALRRESVPDLAGLAAREAARAVSAALGALNGAGDPALLESAIGNGCLSTSTPEGLPVPVRYSDPFDLAPLLIEQTAIRLAWARGERRFG